MKQGRSINEIAAQIVADAAAKVDYLVPTSQAKVVPGDHGPWLHIDTGSEHTAFPISDAALKQVAERIELPIKYLEKLKTQPQLLAENVNTWFKAEPETRLVRTLRGEVRAFLSDSYQRIDHIHVANTLLPILARAGLKFESQEITETRLYIKAVATSLRHEIKSLRVGDFVESGIIIRNSETGFGAFDVSPFDNFLWCLNGVVHNRAGVRSVHVGKKNALTDDMAAIFSDDTKRLEDATLLSKAADVVNAALDPTKVKARIDRYQALTETKMTDVVQTVKQLADIHQLTEGEGKSVLEHLIQGGDISHYGLLNAVTRTAQDAASYDRATELEALGGQLLVLAPTSWERIAA